MKNVDREEEEQHQQQQQHYDYQFFNEKSFYVRHATDYFTMPKIISLRAPYIFNTRHCKSIKNLYQSQITKKKNRSRVFRDHVRIYAEPIIHPKEKYPYIKNYVVTAHYGNKFKNNGKPLMIDQKRVCLYLPHTLKYIRFAAVVLRRDSVTALFFDNGKIVVTGGTSKESNLFALQLYRIELGRVIQPVIYTPSPTDDHATDYIVYKENATTNFKAGMPRVELCFLKTLLGFSNFGIQNTVGSGPITQKDEIVDLASIKLSYPEVNWEPELFPGLKFCLPHGNTIIPGGNKCTAHIFENCIVLMGPNSPKRVKFAYNYFLNLVQPFIVKSTKRYQDDKYVYRFNQMMNMASRKENRQFIPSDDTTIIKINNDNDNDKELEEKEWTGKIELLFDKSRLYLESNQK